MSARHEDSQRRRALAEAVESARTQAGLSIAEAVRRSEADATTKLSRTKWTQIEQGDAPLPSKATIGKVARVLQLDTNVLLAAAGYERGTEVFISHAVADERLVQLIAELLGGELRSIRVAIERLADRLPPGQPTPSGPGPGREALEVGAASAQATGQRRQRVQNPGT